MVIILWLRVRVKTNDHSPLPGLCYVLTFHEIDTPCGWIRRIRQTHIILGIDTEMVLSPRVYVCSEGVAEEAISNGAPNTGVGLMFSHQVVQAVIHLLVRRGCPGDDYFSVDKLF